MDSEQTATSAPVDAVVSTIWKQCEKDRLQKTYEARDEAARWEQEGDWYGWNFYQGVSSGTVEASFIYGRIQRQLEPAMNEMARLLMAMRTDENAAEINAALSAAGYSC